MTGGEVLLDLLAAGPVKVVEHLRRLEQCTLGAQSAKLILVDEDVIVTVDFGAPLRSGRIGDREAQLGIALRDRMDERRLARA